MELRHLRYFVAIAEERSITRAAERLWIAQPGLSTQARRLEAELGVQLLRRHSRGVDLTDAGELFLERARAALAAADDARAVGRDLGSGMSGTIRLGLATGPRWQRAWALLERFARERDRVELTVVEAHGGTLWRDLRDGRLDAVLAPWWDASADLRRVTLGAERWVALVGRGHRLAGFGSVAAEQLAGERIVVTGHRDGTGYDRAVAELLDELAVDAVLERGGPDPALHRSVAHGDALALSAASSGDLVPGVLARPLAPERAMAFVLLWRDETPSPALGELVRLAQHSAQPQRATRPELVVVA